MGIIIAFSGKIGSGKSSISKYIAKLLKWDIVSFGDYVRDMANRNGIEQTRENLQNLGESFIETDPISFCYSVLNQKINWLGNSFIIEGVRHESILDILRKIVEPSHLYHVHLVTSDNKRIERLKFRDNSDKFHSKVDEHPSELDVHQILFNRADLIINTSNLDVQSSSDFVMNWFKSNKIILD